MTSNQLSEMALFHRPKPKDWKGEDYRIIEEKLDGYRVTIVKEVDGTVRALGRRGYAGDHWYQLRKSQRISAMVDRMPEGTVVDCEMWVPGGSSAQVSSALRDPYTEDLRVTPFAIPWLQSVDLRNLSIMEAKALIQQQLRENPPVPFGLILGKGIAFQDRQLALQRAASGKKIEGWILKDSHWRDWYRVKPIRTVDLMIVDCKMGVLRSKLDGMIGSIVVAARRQDGAFVPVANASGMTMAERKEMTEFWAKGDLNNRIVEIAYDSVGAGGRLRFPRFVRWRPDKPAEEIASLEELLS